MMTPDEVQLYLDEQWQRLIDYLNTWCRARTVGPGRIEVTLPDMDGRERVIEIRMTPRQWDNLMVGVMWGGFDDAAEEVRRNLLDAGERQYLIFGDYELNASATTEIPADSGYIHPDEM